MRLSSKGRKLDWVAWMGEEHEMKEDDIAPLLSMNAISGSINDNTLKVKGHLKGKLVMILIDSGSTHT